MTRQRGKLMNKRLQLLGIAALIVGLDFITSANAQTTPADPLRGWNEGVPKRAIIDFVTRVTTQGGAGFRWPVRADRHDRQRWYPLVRATGLFPGIIRV